VPYSTILSISVRDAETGGYCPQKLYRGAILPLCPLSPFLSSKKNFVTASLNISQLISNILRSLFIIQQYTTEAILKSISQRHQRRNMTSLTNQRHQAILLLKRHKNAKQKGRSAETLTINDYNDYGP